MRVHLLQMSLAWEDRQKNFAQVEQLIGSASIRSGDLIVLPELFDSGFSLNTKATRDDSGDTLEFLRTLAVRTQCTIHGSRTTVKPGELALNTVPVLSPAGEIVCEYAKIHPFSFGREPEAFQGGSEVLTYSWGGLTVCPAICYDLRFPELFRLGLLGGADAFAIGANWPAGRAGHWRALNVARAIENQAFVFAVNRCGSDPHLDYAGGSIVVGPKGEILGELADEEGVLSVDIDPAGPGDWRRTFPAWRDVRLLRGHWPASDRSTASAGSIFGSIAFAELEWIEGSPGVREKRVVRDGRVFRLVEFSPPFLEDGWCEKGHSGFVVSGRFEIESEAGSGTLSAGDGFSIGAGRKHRAVIDCPVTLFLIEDE